jgi:serine/threonine protein kinase
MLKICHLLITYFFLDFALSQLSAMQRHSFTVSNSTFVVDSEYQFVEELGQPEGAYGCVVAARRRRSGEGCAIKKITNINTKVSGQCISFLSLKPYFSSVSSPNDA